MTAGAYAHPTISRFAITGGRLRIGSLPVGVARWARRCHSGLHRRPPGLHDR
ncbi:hypothetical protein ACFZAU_37345 [Streptomyces sp. NPDC008238]